MQDTPGLFAQVVASGEPVKDLLLAVSLASLRISSAFALMPPLSDKFMTGSLRRGFILMVALFVAFGVPVDLLHRLTAIEFAAHAAKEVVIGLLLGFVGAKVFWIAQSVGALIDTQAGFNNVQMTNPLSGQQSTPVSELLLHLIVIVFFSLGGMVVFLGALFDSYHVWPMVSALPQLTRVPDLFVMDQTDSLMTAVVKFASPVLIVLMLLDIGFGLVTRSAGKLDVSSLSQPVKGAVTVLMLALLTGTLVSQVRGLLLPTRLVDQVRSSVVAPR
jgi:type III secretion protein T